MPRYSEERWWKVYSVPQHGILRVTILSVSFFGKWSHYDGHSYPCDETPTCKGCQSKTGNRWTGYVAAMSHTHSEQCVIALSEGACQQLRAGVLDKGQNLRGLELTLARKAGKRSGKAEKNSPVLVGFVKRHSSDDLPPEFHVGHSVNRMWGVHMSYKGRALTEEQLRQKQRHKIDTDYRVFPNDVPTGDN